MLSEHKNGVPVKYPDCEGIGVRVVHPANPKAPAENLGLVMFYIPPHVVLEPGSHHTEECYVVIRGKGVMTLAGREKLMWRKAPLSICHHGANTALRTQEMRRWRCSSVPHHRIRSEQMSLFAFMVNSKNK